MPLMLKACLRCGGDIQDDGDVDVFGKDVHCVQCGYRPPDESRRPDTKFDLQRIDDPERFWSKYD